MKPFTIAIDGPAGAGKSTVARRLARRLGYQYVDTGAMYRAVALLVLEGGVTPADEHAVSFIAQTLPVTFAPPPHPDGEQRVFLADADVSDAIRSPEIAALASVVSAIPEVRRALVAEQRRLGGAGGVVMEGRDIGTVVFPDAEVKVFLTASPHARAERRHRDVLARGVETTIDAVRADQDARDARDATRETSPLAVAEGAVEMVSDGKTPDDIVDEILRVIAERGGLGLGAGRE